MTGATRQLLVVRHAEAMAVAPGGDDSQRPLAQRGIAEARALRDDLIRQGCRPGHWAVSSALRAQQTAEELYRSARDGRPSIRSDASLYLADIARLQRALCGFPAVGVVGLVGHNPGLSQWVEHLCGERVQLATAEALLLEFPVPSWDLVVAHSGILLRRCDPARLAAER